MKIKKYIMFAAMAAAAVGAQGRPHAPYEYPRLMWDISSQQVIFQSGNYARLITLQDGRLMAAAESYGPNGIKVSYSVDNGKYWTSPELIAPNPANVGNAVPDLVQLSDGTILVAYNPRPSEPYSEDRHFGIRTMRSTDNGATWEGPIYIYDASWLGQDGCWEPSFLEMPDGEVHCYFANEHPYTESGEQEISMCRSFDKGLTWSDPERVTFRAGSRDGMPSAIITDAGEIVVIVEDNGHGGYSSFRATTMRCTVEENWHDCWVSGSSDRRNMIFSNAEDKEYLSAAPYIRKLPSGYTIASWQGLAGNRPGGNEDMFVAVGDKDARNFMQVSAPFSQPTDSRSLWNSVNVGFDGKVFALGSLSGPNSGSAITLLEGFTLDHVSAAVGTPKIDASFSGEDWTVKKCEQIILGQGCRTRSTHDFLYDNDYLYFFSYVQDNQIMTDQIEKDGVYLTIDVENTPENYPQPGMYRIFYNVDGTVTFTYGSGNRWNAADEVPEGIKTEIKQSRAYYFIETAIPWSALGLESAPVDRVMRVNVEISDRRSKEHRKEAIPGAVANQSWTWPEFHLLPGDLDGVETAVADNNGPESPVEYYNLQGVRVENPSDGIFIRRQGSKVTKEIIR
ncbi:MAG: hypothetical protein HDS68_03965 [Bacteroidales bacterium]|nr:hypothetical protein [Bacteroidales bacterium]